MAQITMKSYLLVVLLFLGASFALPKVSDLQIKKKSPKYYVSNATYEAKVENATEINVVASSAPPETVQLTNLLGIQNGKGFQQVCVYSKHISMERSNSDSMAIDGDYEDTDYDNDDEVKIIPQLMNTTVQGLGQVQVEICEPRAKFCYAIWKEEDAGQITILGQGCWSSSGVQKVCSDSKECQSDPNRYRPHQSTKFCCCKLTVCNASPVSGIPSSITASPMDVSSSSPTVIDNPINGFGYVILVASIFLTVAAIAVLFFVLKYRRKSKNQKTDPELSVNNHESGGPGFSCSATCVDNLKLHDNIGCGKYSKVWCGSLGGVPVAVKALPVTQSNLWAREKEMYCLPHMRHSNLLQYFGCDTRPTLEGPLEHLLVLQLAPLGSLKKYLIENTLDWDTYTNMALGVASAVAHLHTSIDKDGLYKPCIIHRDINSSNVLVRADLTCCLGDLGLSMAIPDHNNTITQLQYRIQEAGTLRYLAPETLEGSLDLRRCAASLRAVDIYALALVLWELLSRCSTLYRAPGPLPYCPPFQAELGDHPTLEKMQVLVAKRKARPLFSPRLLPFRATKLAKDTCEDCWDHDAEARLTAVCVVERLTELKSMKPATSPTINSNDLRPPSQNQDSMNPSPMCEDKINNITSSIGCNKNVLNMMDFQANIMQKLPLQPHQGRNPCLERNLASVELDDEPIDKSLKDMPSNFLNSDYGVNFSRPEPSNLEPYDFSRFDEQSSRSARNQNGAFQQNLSDSPLIVNHDDQIMTEFRQLARPLTPIGYVQNDVSSDVNGIVVSVDNPYGYPAKCCNVPQDTNPSKWSTRRLKTYLDSKLFKKKAPHIKPVPFETEVNLVLSNGKPVNNDVKSGRFKTSVIVNDTKSKTNNDPCVDRPFSLPGLNSNAVSDYNGDGVKFGPKNSDLEGRYNVTPPNQTIPCNSLVRPENFDNMVVGYKEMPDESSQIFAVIVPKPSYQSVKEPNRSSISLTRPLEPSKVENILLQSDDKSAYEPKKFKHFYRNSYSGEFEIGNIFSENKENDFDGNVIDYSSNSEDEHMLLLAENGGSKITMRQRYDVKPKDLKSKRNRQISSSRSVQDAGLSKMANDGFPNLLASKGYENLDDKYQRKPNTLGLKDGTFLNRNSNLRLSICKLSNEDLISFNESSERLNRNSDTSDKIDNLTSDDDASLVDDVFVRKSPSIFRPLSIKQNLSRQHSLELVNELFSSSADLARLKDPASRIKTPGDVPPSVRRVRGSIGAAKFRRTGSARDSSKLANRLSLYDDRMMFGNSL